MAKYFGGEALAARPPDVFTASLPHGTIVTEMYEGPIKAADFAGTEETPILRQLRWTDLVARIAARAPRATVADPADEPHASFAAFHLAADSEGQRTINHDALTHGKLSRIFPPEAANNAGEGDREIR